MLFIGVQTSPDTQKKQLAVLNATKTYLEQRTEGYPLYYEIRQYAADGTSVLLPQAVTGRKQSDANLVGKV